MFPSSMVFMALANGRLEMGKNTFLMDEKMKRGNGKRERKVDCNGRGGEEKEKRKK